MEEYLRFVPLVAAATFSLFMIYGSLCDLATYKIPNWISLASLACFLLAAIYVGWNWETLAYHIGAGLVVLGGGFFLYIRGYCGGGDVKLLATSAVWIGWQWLPQFLLVVAVFGGILALFILLFRFFKLSAALRERPWIRRLHDKNNGVPYAVAVTAAVLFLFPRIAIFNGFVLG